MIFIMIIWLDNQLDSTGPVRSIGDQLLQTMGEIYQQVDLGDNGGAVGRAGIFGAELNGKGGGFERVQVFLGRK